MPKETSQTNQISGQQWTQSRFKSKLTRSPRMARCVSSAPSIPHSGWISPRLSLWLWLSRERRCNLKALMRYGSSLAVLDLASKVTHPTVTNQPSKFHSNALLNSQIKLTQSSGLCTSRFALVSLWCWLRSYISSGAHFSNASRGVKKRAAAKAKLARSASLTIAPMVMLSDRTVKKIRMRASRMCLMSR